MKNSEISFSLRSWGQGNHEDNYSSCGPGQEADRHVVYAGALGGVKPNPELRQ